MSDTTPFASSPADDGPTQATILPESAVPAILSAIEGLRFGQVTVIVQDGRVLQIDRTERIRLAKQGNASGDDTEAGKPST